jgi:hypothetical protein
MDRDLSRHDNDTTPDAELTLVQADGSDAGPIDLIPWQRLDTEQRLDYARITTVRTGHRGIRVFLADELGVGHD